jgi:hypothetical protein
MIKKIAVGNGQVVTNDRKRSKIPSDFEPVSRKKQDEEGDIMFQNMGDNASFASDRVSDDEDGSDDAYHPDDRVANEDILHVDDNS